MEELIKVTVKNDQQLVSARDLHKGLQLTTRFSKWVSQNFNEFEEDIDFMSVTAVTDMPNGGTKPIKDYALTLDMAKELCMMSHTELGKKYRHYFIELEKKWNDPMEIVKRGYAILQNENAQLRIANEKMKPKALFADAVSTAKTNILIGELAKILKANGVDHITVNGKQVTMGQNHFFQWLRENGYLIKRKGTDYNAPTQMAMNKKLFKVKESTSINANGTTRINKTTKVTGIGQQYFANLFLAA